jgi:hypothetical protein
MINEIIAMTKPADGEKTPPAEPPTEPMEDELPAEKKEVPMKDSAEFKNALAESLKKHTAVIVKAKDFVDAAFDFSGKSTDEIMRAALASEHGKQDFTDEELPIAFKLLKKQEGNLRNFGDSNFKKDKFAEIGEKEI